MMSFKKYKEKWEEKERKLKEDYRILRESHPELFDQVEAEAHKFDERKETTIEEDKKILNQKNHIEEIQAKMPQGSTFGEDYAPKEEESDPEEDRKILREGHQTNWDLVEKRSGANLLEADKKMADPTAEQIREDKKILGQKIEEIEEKKQKWSESEGQLFSFDIQDTDEWQESIENKENMLISGSIISVGERSKNGKTYPLESCRKSAADLQERLKAGEIIPLLDGHPLSEQDSSTQAVIGKIKSVEFDEDEIGFVGEISSTPRALACQTLIRDNCVEGLSLGAEGNFDGESGIVKNFALEHLALTWKPSSSAKIKSILN